MALPDYLKDQQPKTESSKSAAQGWTNSKKIRVA
jgi:hypothetical protein